MIPESVCSPPGSSECTISWATTRESALAKITPSSMESARTGPRRPAPLSTRLAYVDEATIFVRHHSHGPARWSIDVDVLRRVFPDTKYWK